MSKTSDVRRYRDNIQREVDNAAITLMTGRTVLQSGGRQLLFGVVATSLTFGIGRLMGVALGG
jgi:hypothetical protein